MSNVVRFTRPGKTAELSASKTVVTAAVGNILMANLRLANAIREFSTHIEVIDRTISLIDDIESQNRLRQTLKQLCEKLKESVVDLSEAVRTLPAVQRELTDTVAFLGQAKSRDQG